ncbi:hypothetical protein MKW98_030669 [Papaver atlanticum]|uniref:PIN domain-containing protein n=1 Tax=Papaver atlanticum TaxID=357466 RepID=A0AAD4RUD1_9MAGN|nr:hypothetical protein MKW98_030669 [Papaver atlanticum]
MGKEKISPKFTAMKRLISSKMIKKTKEDILNPRKKGLEKEKSPRNMPQVSSALFFKHNSALVPPDRVLVDTNFINFSIQNKLDLEKAMIDCLYAKSSHRVHKGFSHSQTCSSGFTPVFALGVICAGFQPAIAGLALISQGMLNLKSSE